MAYHNMYKLQIKETEKIMDIKKYQSSRNIITHETIGDTLDRYYLILMKIPFSRAEQNREYIEGIHHSIMPAFGNSTELNLKKLRNIEKRVFWLLGSIKNESSLEKNRFYFPMEYPSSNELDSSKGNWTADFAVSNISGSGTISW